MPGSPSLVGRAPGNCLTIKRVLAREREFKSPSRRHLIIIDLSSPFSINYGQQTGVAASIKSFIYDYAKIEELIKTFKEKFPEFEIMEFSDPK